MKARKQDLLIFSSVVMSGYVKGMDVSLSCQEALYFLRLRIFSSFCFFLSLGSKSFDLLKNRTAGRFYKVASTHENAKLREKCKTVKI